ncbi:hypothetical protein [Chitinasiproducens palmae]|nr:hypothetical protein [Chitinasiproducens palmae]
MTKKKLIVRDANGDIGAELLAAVKQMKAGKAARITEVKVCAARQAHCVAGLSQTPFAQKLRERAGVESDVRRKKQ